MAPPSKPARDTQSREESKADARIEELLVQIREGRKKAEQDALRLFQAAQELYRLGRGSEMAPTYVTYANAHLRVFSAIQQGVQRAGSMDRLLKRAVEDRDQEREREVRAAELALERKQAAERLAAIQLGEGDDLEDLYGA